VDCISKILVATASQVIPTNGLESNLTVCEPADTVHLVDTTCSIGPWLMGQRDILRSKQFETVLAMKHSN